MALGTANALVPDASIQTTPITATSANPEQTVYEVGNAGTVTIAKDGSVLSVASVNQAPGWVIEIETASGREVEVDFRNGDTRVQFNAELEDGQIRVRAVERSDTGASTTSTSTSTSTTGTTDTSTSTTASTSTTVIGANVAAGVTAGATRYDAGAAGSVDIVRSGAVLEITSVNPAAGWTFEVEVRTGREVELDFRRGGERVQFNAELEDGEIRVRVRTRTDDSSGGTTSGADDRSDDSSDDSRSNDDASSDDGSDDDHSDDDSSDD